MSRKKQRWQVYILECKDGSLYTGMTCDVQRRYKEHVRGSSRYTSYNPPVRLLYAEDCNDRSGALKRECQIKSWPRSKKLVLVGSGAHCDRRARRRAKKRSV